MSQNSSMSLFLNCASAIIDVTAKVAYVLFMSCGNVDHRLPLGLWHPHIPRTGLPVAVGPWTQMRSSDATGIMDNMALGRSMDHRHPTWPSPFSGLTDPASCHYGPRWRCRLPTLTWPPAAALSIDLNMASGDSTDLGHSRGLW